MSRNYYIFRSGRIKREEKTVLIEIGQNEKKFIPIEDIDQLFVFSEVDLNTAFLNFASQNKILIHFFNYYGFYSGSFVPRESNVSGTLVVKQCEFYLDQSKRLEIARRFVEGAAHNIKRNLEKKGGFDAQVKKIKELIDEIHTAKDIPDLMSIEAHVRKTYYSCLEAITGWEFGSREYHPPSNPLNALISFGNSLVYTQVLKAVYQTPLNPSVSYLHEPSERRFSLCLDVSEIFKPILSDRLTLKLVNLGIIKKEKHFDKDLNFAYLTEEGRRIFVEHFDKLLEETIYHRTLKRKVKYKNLILLELYKIIKYLLGDEKSYEPLKVWW